MSSTRRMSLRKEPPFYQQETFSTGVQKEVTVSSNVGDRHSGVNAPIFIEAVNNESHEFCVFREFPRHKTAHLRFITSVYAHKYSTADDEDSICPVMECRSGFADREAMCQHLLRCPRLSKGRYWCSDCGQLERISRFHCKRCPSRATSVARRFFSMLGQKTHKENQFTAGSETGTTSSVISNCLASSTSKSMPDGRRATSGHPPNTQLEDIIRQDIPEMGGQWENTYLDFQARDWDTSSSGQALQELSETSICEMPGLDRLTELPTSSPLNLSNTNPTVPWFNASSAMPPTSDSSYSAVAPPQRALIQLQTRDFYQPQNQTHQQSGTTDSFAKTFSPTIISPMSPETRRMDAPVVPSISPTDSETSHQSVWTEPMLQVQSWNSSMSSMDETSSSKANDGLRLQTSTEFSMDFGTEVFESPTDCDAPIEQFSSSMDFPSSLHATYSNTESESNSNFHNYSDAPSLVQSFGEILEVQLRHSKTILETMLPTPIIMDLVDLNPRSIVSIGLEVLAAILKGNTPTAIMPLFAFTHIAYAFAISVRNDASQSQAEKWFKDSLFWVCGLQAKTDQKVYAHIACAIWQPAVLEDGFVQSRESSSKDSLANPENKLITACKVFLDAWETFERFSASSSSSFSQGRAVHPDLLRMIESQIIDNLMRKFHYEGFIKDIVNQVERHHFTDIRSLELQLIDAGKNDSCPEAFKTRFLEHVTKIFDAVYAREHNTSPSRRDYHLQDILHIKQFIEEEGIIDENLGSEEEYDHQIDGTAAMARKGTIESFAGDAESTLKQICYISGTNTETVRNSPHSRRAHTLDFVPLTAPSSPPREYRCECGYTPKGKDRWKASNLTRHKRTQHPEETKVFACNYPGCGSTFNRSDNLRQHSREKGHLDDMVLNLDFIRLGGSGGGKRKQKRRRTADDY